MATRKRSRPHKPPVAVEVFAGIGGLSLGLERSGFDVAAAVELDRNHAAVHRFNFPRTALLEQDAAAVSGAALVAAALAGAKAHGSAITARARVDLLAGGPPCQGFSAGGKHDPADQRNELVFEFARIVQEVQPRYFLMENVPGLLGPKHSSTWNRLLNKLGDAGYDMAPPAVLNACAFGVPQQRKRLFLYGWRRGEDKIEPPVERAGAPISVEDAFALLPNAARFDELYSGDILLLDRLDRAGRERMAEGGSPYASKMRSTKAAKGFVRPWNRRAITGMALTRHEATVVRRFESTKPGERESVSRYARLVWAGQSPTLRSGTGADHGSHTPPRPIHPDGSRVITVREAARLHSFPDWFSFHATKWHAWRGIGNSVPPFLAEAVIGKVAERLDVRDNEREPLPWGDPLTIGYEAVW